MVTRIHRRRPPQPAYGHLLPGGEKATVDAAAEGGTGAEGSRGRPRTNGGGLG